MSLSAFARRVLCRAGVWAQEIKWPALLTLLKARAPAAVEAVLLDCFRYRHEGLSAARVEAWAASLPGATSAVSRGGAAWRGAGSQLCSRFRGAQELEALSVSATRLVQQCVFAAEDAAGVGAQFPSDFHPQLKSLLARIVEAHLAEWRRAAAAQQVGVRVVCACSRSRAHSRGGRAPRTRAPRLAVLADAAAQVSAPKLIDFDWRVDVKTSSNIMSRMAVPTVIVDMALQRAPERQGVLAGVQHVQFELSKQSLATMLDGLTKIRDQLGNLGQ
jgi:hypothetical protein